MFDFIKRWINLTVIIIYKIIWLFSKIQAAKFLHFCKFWYKLNLKNPRTLNDKLQYLNLYYRKNLIINCADKYKVREYIKECWYEQILNKLYNTYDNTNEIDRDKLPNKFAIKCNHGSWFNIICNNKKTLDVKKSTKLLKKRMKKDFSKFHNER